MQPYHWSIVGLSLDIVGAFFVSVEAIKLENLRRLRDTVVRSAHSRVLKLWRGPGGPAEGSSLLFQISLFVLMPLLVLVLVAAIAVLIEELRNTRSLVDQIGLSIAYLFIICTFGLLVIGYGILPLLSSTLSTIVSAMDIIDRRTADGTIGIIGFCLLVLGFICQAYGSWLGRAAT